MWIVQQILPGDKSSGFGFIVETALSSFFIGWLTYLCFEAKDWSLGGASFGKGCGVILAVAALLMLGIFTLALTSSFGKFNVNWFVLAPIVALSAGIGSIVSLEVSEEASRKYQKISSSPN